MENTVNFDQTTRMPVVDALDQENPERILYRLDNVSVFSSTGGTEEPDQQKQEQNQTLLITSRRLHWFNEQKGVNISWHNIILHAISRDTSTGFPACMYLQLSNNHNQEDNEDSPLSEVRIIPNDAALLETVFEHMTEAASMNPDPINEEEIDGNAFFDSNLQTAEDQIDETSQHLDALSTEDAEEHAEEQKE